MLYDYSCETHNFLYMSHCIVSYISNFSNSAAILNSFSFHCTLWFEVVPCRVTRAPLVVNPAFPSATTHISFAFLRNFPRVFYFAFSAAIFQRFHVRLLPKALRVRLPYLQSMYWYYALRVRLPYLQSMYWYYCSFAMAAKPMKTLELHYPIIHV